MKKFSFLILVCMLLTIGGVYATWTYTQSTDVADEAINLSMNLTKVTYIGAYGSYEVDATGLTMIVDPKEGTTHTTALYMDGKIVITFTPNTYAPETVKENAVDSTFEFSSSSDWKYNDTAVVTIKNPGKHDIAWEKQADGTFTYTLTAEQLYTYFDMNEFNLDTKVSYDAFNTVLGKGSVVINVSDGITATSQETPEN